MMKAVLITEENITKDEIRERIREEQKIENVKELEAKGGSKLTTLREW